MFFSHDVNQDKSRIKESMYEMCVCYIIKRGVYFLLSLSILLFYSLFPLLRYVCLDKCIRSSHFFLSRRRRRLQQQGKHGGRWSARVRLCPFIQERWHTRTLSAQ